MYFVNLFLKNIYLMFCYNVFKHIGYVLGNPVIDTSCDNNSRIPLLIEICGGDVCSEKKREKWVEKTNIVGDTTS